MTKTTNITVQQELIAIEAEVFRFLLLDYLDNQNLIGSLIGKLFEVEEDFQSEDLLEEIQFYHSSNKGVGEILEELIALYSPKKLHEENNLVEETLERLPRLKAFNVRLDEIVDLPVPEITEENAEQVNLLNSLKDNIEELVSRNKKLDEGLSLVVKGIEFIFTKI